MSFTQDPILLFRQLASRGEGSFKDLYAYYILPVMRLCRYITHDGEQAKEACMDTFMVLWHRRFEVAGMESPAAWLFQTARNTSHNAVRKVAKLKNVGNPGSDITELPSGLPDAHDRMELIECNHQLQLIIQALPPRQREIIGYKLQGFDRARIAAICGISKDTVKAHLTTAYDRLRKKLEVFRENGL
ncbi:MAG: sigma-70 family RNA polymerase sigma factor [Chitinophagaceae bacterium]|nr:MAG: sigma-70 family RNA polymerase sigma factor [Chitinophagaceae bacterium]